MTDLLRNTTPGAWGIEHCPETLWIGPMRPDGIKVDEIVTSLDHGGYYIPEYNARQAANARLIASAPTLAAENAQLKQRVERLSRASLLALDFIQNRQGNDAAETVVVSDLRTALAQASEPSK